MVALRALVEDLGGARSTVDYPEQLFGPWNELGPNARTSFRRMVEDEINGTMRWFPQGTLWNGLIRGGWELDRYMAESGFLSPARRPLIRWIHRLAFGPINLRNRWLLRTQASSWANDQAPTLGSFLVAIGRRPSWLLGDFVEGVRVDARARGYYLDPGRNLTWGYHIGLDLIPTPKGIICLEGNLQVGIGEVEDGRPELQPDNPTLRILCEAARTHKARRIYWLEGHRGPLPPWFMREFLQGTRAAGLRTEFFDHPRMRRRRGIPTHLGNPKRAAWLADEPDDTLVIRRNEFPVGSDFVINDKDPFVRVLERVFREKGETRVRVLPQTRVPPEFPSADGPGLPNLVYKYPDSLQARGVFFLRAKDRDHALTLAREVDARTGEAPGVFQRFVLPELRPGDRVCDVRSEIFISPLGTWFLGGFWRIAGEPVPMELPIGIAEAQGALASNLAVGGTLAAVEGEDLVRFGEASVAVGDALRAGLHKTFETGPV
jgi:hypothetical protein